MKGISEALWAESLKICRSKMLWFTILASVFMPSMIGLLIFVTKNPEFSSKLGMIGTKAATLRFGQADWITYFGLLNQIIAGAGLLGFAFATSWIFGREYSDHTIKDLLALPVSRSSIVLSKFIVMVIWCVLLSFLLFICGLIIGGVIHLSGWSNEIALCNAIKFTVTSLLTILMCTPLAFFASYGRGFLPPIGFAILTLIMSQFTGLVGLGPFFPWGIPLLYSTAGGTEGAQLGVASYIILCFTSIVGLLGTLAWYRFADQT